MKKFVLAAVFAMGLAAPAFASQCPGLMAKIDEALKTASLSDDAKAEVKEYYDKGKAEHESGDHGASVKDLMEATKILGI